MNIKTLFGLTMTQVIGEELDPELVFVTNTGRRFHLYHEQDCCEQVYISQIDGDLSDLVGTPLWQVDEVTQRATRPEGTWTFYKFATVKGSVTVRWLGESNGYYSEQVHFEEILTHEATWVNHKLNAIRLLAEAVHDLDIAPPRDWA